MIIIFLYFTLAISLHDNLLWNKLDRRMGRCVDRWMDGHMNLENKHRLSCWTEEGRDTRNGMKRRRWKRWEEQLLTRMGDEEGIFSRCEKEEKKMVHQGNASCLYTANDSWPFCGWVLLKSSFFTRLCSSQLYSLHSQSHLFVHEAEEKKYQHTKNNLGKPAASLWIKHTS